MSDILNRPPADSAPRDIFNGPTADSFLNPISPSASTPAPGQPADGGGWLASLPDDLRGVAEHKGWKDPADALRSYRHLEEYMGADKAGRGLVLPKDGADVEGYERVYKALGRPEEAAGYELNSLFGDDVVDERVLGGMAQAMHEAGLSKTQAHKMGAAYQEMFKAALAEGEAQYASEVEETKSSLPPETIESARRGFRLLRLPPEEAEGVSRTIERALGPRAATELFARLGRAVGEDRPPEGSLGVDGDAGRRIDQLLSDKDFNARYLAGDQAAIKRINDLYSRMAGA